MYISHLPFPLVPHNILSSAQSALDLSLQSLLHLP